MQLINKKTFSLFFCIAEFFAIYASCSVISNALYSNAIALLLLGIVYICHEKHLIKTSILPLPDKKFSIVYFSFFLLIILDSIFLGQRDSLALSLKHVYWCVLPFFVFYISLRCYFYERMIITAIGLGTCTLCSYGLYQFVIFPFGTRIQSYLYHPNALGQFLLLSIPFLIMYFVHRKKTFFHWVIGLTACIGCFVLVLTGSRGAIGGFCIGGIFCLLIQIVLTKSDATKIVQATLNTVIMISVLLVIFLFSFGKSKIGVYRPYDHERVLLWQSGYQMWKDHKWLGIGLNRWSQEYKKNYISPKAKEPDLKHPHNTFIYFFSTTGILGGGGYLFFTFGMLFYLLCQLKKEPNNIFLNALLWVFLALIIHEMVDNIAKDEIRLFNTYLGIGLASIKHGNRYTLK